jgi:hypothetical protein
MLYHLLKSYTVESFTRHYYIVIPFDTSTDCSWYNVVIYTHFHYHKRGSGNRVTTV